MTRNVDTPSARSAVRIRWACSVTVTWIAELAPPKGMARSRRLPPGFLIAVVCLRMAARIGASATPRDDAAVVRVLEWARFRMRIDAAMAVGAAVVPEDWQHLLEQLERVGSRRIGRRHRRRCADGWLLRIGVEGNGRYADGNRRGASRRNDRSEAFAQGCDYLGGCKISLSPRPRG